jgi:hypothetical protein
VRPRVDGFPYFCGGRLLSGVELSKKAIIAALCYPEWWALPSLLMMTDAVKKKKRGWKAIKTHTGGYIHYVVNMR